MKKSELAQAQAQEMKDEVGMDEESVEDLFLWEGDDKKSESIEPVSDSPDSNKHNEKQE